jgi:hypothetical protein
MGGAALVAAVVPWSGGVGTGESATNPDQIVAAGSVFRDEPDLALTEWALTRFDQAGLRLPPVILRFHDGKTPCQGQNGYFRPDSPHRVDICGFNWDRFLVTPRKVILHELGHVWAHENLDAETRQDFIDMRDLEVWQDRQVPWAEQGQEHAAEILAWGLMDEEISMTSIGESDPAQLVVAYQILTSSEMP